MKKISGGLTILEVLMSTTVFSLLAGVLFYIFCTSAQAWLKVRNSVDLKSSAQIVLSRIEREIRASSIDSVEIIEYPSGTGNEAICFLSAFVYDPPAGEEPGTKWDFGTGAMEWKRYLIFYVEDDTRVAQDGYYQIWSKEVDLYELNDNYGTYTISGSDGRYGMPYPPLDLTPRDQTKNLSEYVEMSENDYVSQARPITRNISLITFEKEKTRDIGKVEIFVQAKKPVNPNDPSSLASKENVELKSIVVLRNK